MVAPWKAKAHSPLVGRKHAWDWSEILNLHNIADGWLDAPLAFIAANQGYVLLVLCVSTVWSLLLSFYATFQAIGLRGHIKSLRLLTNRLIASEEKRTLKRLADGHEGNTQ